MPIKTMNFTIDLEEYRFALKKKQGRTWREVFLDGLEWKKYEPVKKKKA
jgi:hypothetical protein